MQKIAYDPQRDFAPIGLIASNPLLLVVDPSVPAKTVQELIALARVGDAFGKAIGDPATRTALENQGAEPGSANAEAFAALIRRDLQKYARVVKASGAKIE